jgi:3-oxoacyl-[acyl-carrier protein] reductase
MKVALVTGASTGIGAAAALALGAKGWAVAVNYRESAHQAEDVARRVTAVGGRGVAMQGDVTRAEDVTRLVTRTVAELGGLDALINNAGSPVQRAPLAEMDEATWDACVDLNLKSVWLCARAAIPHLRTRKGTIINVSSAAAHSGGSPGSGHYAAAKAGVHALTRALAKELAPDVTCNCIAPGLVDTPFHTKFSTPEHVARHVKATPLGRAGQPAELGAWIAFLVEAPFTTGQVYDVNGGLVMAP